MTLVTIEDSIPYFSDVLRLVVPPVIGLNTTSPVTGDSLVPCVGSGCGFTEVVPSALVGTGSKQEVVPRQTAPEGQQPDPVGQGV